MSHQPSLKHHSPKDTPKHLHIPPVDSYCPISPCSVSSSRHGKGMHICLISYILFRFHPSTVSRILINIHRYTFKNGSFGCWDAFIFFKCLSQKPISNCSQDKLNQSRAFQHNFKGKQQSSVPPFSEAILIGSSKNVKGSKGWTQKKFKFLQSQKASFKWEKK